MTVIDVYNGPKFTLCLLDCGDWEQVTLKNTDPEEADINVVAEFDNIKILKFFRGREDKIHKIRWSAPNLFDRGELIKIMIRGKDG